MDFLTPEQIDGTQLVDAEVIGRVIGIPTKSVLRLAVSGKIPNYEIPSAQGDGLKHFRKFSIPEVKTALFKPSN